MLVNTYSTWGKKRKTVWTFEGILTFPRTFLLDMMQVLYML